MFAVDRGEITDLNSLTVRHCENNVCSGHWGKNRSELSLKSTVGNFFEELIRSSIYHFAINKAEWPTVQ
jgi:hypothetical protein